MISSVSRWTIALLLVTPVFAQNNMRPRLSPISAPVRRAGVYHVATGTWTRNGSLANVTGPDTIYNNTCAPVYFARMQLGDDFQHRSRIPSTSGPTTPSIFYPTTGQNDEAPGCHDSYTVNGFEIAYCSSAATSVDWQYDFASLYMMCAGADLVPQHSVHVTGLPGGTAGGLQACWIVDVDVSGNSSGGLVLSADGDGTYNGSDTFGFGFGPASSVALSDFTGPLIAGDYTWTGGPVAGQIAPCTGTDGTIWDNPINLAEAGTGMTSSNFIRITGPSPSLPAGCYTTSPIHADFYLKLFADPQCPPGPLLTDFCFPGEAGIKSCTTCSPANPPSAHGRGCNNYGQSTGGATLTSVGNPRVTLDTVVFTSQFENNTAFTVLMQGTATTNLVFGAGVRCIGGNQKRIYIGSAGSAANADPPGTIHRPGLADTRHVHQASLDVGYDIGAHAPVTLYYQAFYRDPNATSHCGGATLNASEAGSLNWIP